MHLSQSILPSTVGIALVCAICYCPSAWAQGRRGGGIHPPKQSGRAPQPRPGKQANPGAKAGGPRQVEEFMRMSPEEREREISKLPPARQARLRERLQEYDRMTPAQKERLQRQWERLSQLSPERQQEVRQSVRDFTELPQERRQAMRRELARVQRLSPDERKDYFKSPEFTSQFSPEEQKIMKNMNEVLEPQ